jgi:hypothetical protein
VHAKDLESRRRRHSSVGTVTLGRHDIRVLLEDLQRKAPQSRKRKPSESNQVAKGVVSVGRHGSGDFAVSRRSGPRGPAPVKASSSDMCAYWETGQLCPYEPSCRFRHACSACGKVETHDPKGCKFRAVNRGRAPSALTPRQIAPGFSPIGRLGRSIM